MRRVIVCGLIIWVMAATALVALAAEPDLQAGSGITSPVENAVVRGTVPIVGVAIANDFWKFEVYFGPDPNPGEQWTFIGAVHEKPVSDGLLEAWQTDSIPDGRYMVRLRVVNRTGNYQDFVVRGIQVANAAPTATPLPTLTPVPTPTITPAATPTFMIPTSDLAQPSATPTLARPNRSVLPETIDLASWSRSMCLGAEVMIGLVVLIAVVMAARRRC